MKELSIEEKAKRYDEAIERAKGVIEQNPLMEYLKKGIEYIFPELKESDDEKIRKGIIRNLEYLMDRAEGFVKDELKERIAWLEKQGNLMKALQISNARIGELIEKNYYLKEQLEKQSEQKPADNEPKFKVGDWIINTESEYIRQILKINNGCYETDYGVLPIKDYESFSVFGLSKMQRMVMCFVIKMKFHYISTILKIALNKKQPLAVLFIIVAMMVKDL